MYSYEKHGHKKYLQTAAILNFADVHIFKSGEYAIPFTSDRMIFANHLLHLFLSQIWYIIYQLNNVYI